jgi:hypothetical protein
MPPGIVAPAANASLFSAMLPSSDYVRDWSSARTFARASIMRGHYLGVGSCVSITAAFYNGMLVPDTEIKAGFLCGILQFRNSSVKMLRLGIAPSKWRGIVSNAEDIPYEPKARVPGLLEIAGVPIEPVN